MSSLSYEVLRSIRALRDTPALAGELLRSLEDKAKRAFDGAWVAINSPIADKTWETRIAFPSDQAESPLAEVTIPRPAELVGIKFTVVPASFAPAPPLVLPTLDDLEVSILIDREDELTSQEPTTAGAGPTRFASVSACDVTIGNRLFAKKMRAPNPLMEFTYRWKQGPNVFVTSLVSATCYIRYL